MRAVKQRDNASELSIRSILHRHGLRFRVHRHLIPGRSRTVDVVLAKAKIAVFVDGCFWHSCPRHATLPKANREWWRAKLQANKTRDRQTDRALVRLGWRVMRIWEHEAADAAAQKIINAASASQMQRSTASVLSFEANKMRLKTVKENLVDAKRAAAQAAKNARRRFPRKRLRGEAQKFM